MPKHPGYKRPGTARIRSHADWLRCPERGSDKSFAPSHYHYDGTCRCVRPEETP